jgi:hypothetical protein
MVHRTPQSSLLPSFDRQDHDPKWYFVFAPDGSNSTISPVKMEVKGPKTISFKFESPQVPFTIPLKLHVISDSYVGLDWVSNHVLEVNRKLQATAFKHQKRRMCQDDEEEYFFGCSRSEFVGFVRSLNPGAIVRPTLFEKIMLSFCRQKAAMRKTRPTQLLTESDATSKLGDEVLYRLGVRLMDQDWNFT